MGSNVGQCLILDDAPARQVLVLCLGLAPAGHGLAAGNAHALPCVARFNLVVGGVSQPFHLLIQPYTATGLAQLLQHHRKDGREVGYVADRIVDLALVQRAPCPVREPRALVEADAQPAIDQIGIADLLALAQRHARDLGVEERMRRLAGQVEDDFDVLPASMEDLEHVLIVDQQVEQRRHVESRGLGVDRRSFLPVGDLEKAQLRPIGVLAHELGVHGDEVRLGQSRAQGGERTAVSD